jgi:hypothetical protein
VRRCGRSRYPYTRPLMRGQKGRAARGMTAAPRVRRWASRLDATVREFRRLTDISAAGDRHQFRRGALRSFAHLVRYRAKLVPSRVGLTDIMRSGASSGAAARVLHKALSSSARRGTEFRASDYVFTRSL